MLPVRPEVTASDRLPSAAIRGKLFNDDAIAATMSVRTKFFFMNDLLKVKV